MFLSSKSKPFSFNQAFAFRHEVQLADVYNLIIFYIHLSAFHFLSNSCYLHILRYNNLVSLLNNSLAKMFKNDTKSLLRISFYNTK